jgi:hypothetical protein
MLTGWFYIKFGCNIDLRNLKQSKNKPLIPPSKIYVANFWSKHNVILKQPVLN